MTRIVLYDREDHEALTVVEIPISYMREVAADRMHVIRLALPQPPVRASDWIAPTEPHQLDRDIVELKMEAVHRYFGRGRESEILFWYAYPSDPALALRLRSVFLPGQLPEVQRRERESEFRGALMGLKVGLGL